MRDSTGRAPLPGKERFFDPRLGKDKLAVLLKEDGSAHLSPSTVGRMLKDLKQQGVLPDPRPLSFHAKTGRHREKTMARRKKLRSTRHEGPLIKADTVVRFIDGTKRHILTALDVESKFAFAYASTSHTSTAAAEFMHTFKAVAPLSLTHVQTDNGSEFAVHFDVALDAAGIVHFHAYPRSPKPSCGTIGYFLRTTSMNSIASSSTGCCGTTPAGRTNHLARYRPCATLYPNYQSWSLKSAGRVHFLDYFSPSV